MAPAFESSQRGSSVICGLRASDTFVSWDRPAMDAFQNAHGGCFTMRCNVAGREAIVLGLKMAHEDCANLQGDLPIEFGFESYFVSSGVVLVWGLRFFDRPDDPFNAEHLIDPLSGSHVHHVRLATRGPDLLMPIVDKAGQCVTTKSVSIGDGLSKVFEKALGEARAEARRKGPQNFQQAQQEYARAYNPGHMFGQEHRESKNLLAETLNEAVDRMRRIYRANPQCFVRGQGGELEQELREIGMLFDRLGGMNLMRVAWDEFARRCEVRGAARNLEFMWDGIGDWRG